MYQSNFLSIYPPSYLKSEHAVNLHHYSRLKVAFNVGLIALLVKARLLQFVVEDDVDTRDRAVLTALGRFLCRGVGPK